MLQLLINYIKLNKLNLSKITYFLAAATSSPGDPPAAGDTAALASPSDACIAPPAAALVGFGAID